MNPHSDNGAADRVERIRAFREELAALEDERALVLTSEQRSKLHAHHERLLALAGHDDASADPDQRRRISWGMRLTTVLGAGALFTAVILFLHRYWGALPWMVQVALLVVAPLVLIIATEYTWRRRVDPFYVGLCAWVSALSLVFALDALASIHNVVVPSHVLFGAGTWATVMGTTYRRKSLLGAGLATLCAWTAAIYLESSGRFWPALLTAPAALIPGAAVLYFWPMLRVTSREFAPVYRLTGACIGLFAMLIWSRQGGAAALGMSRSAGEALCEVVGLFLSAAAAAEGVRHGQRALMIMGTLMFTAFLFLRMHAWFWHWMPKYLFFMCLSGLAVLVLLVFRRMRAQVKEAV